MHLGTTVHHDLLFRKLKSLKMVCICMRAGEELLYIDFLYGITSIGRGLIEFVNATHWLVRPQRAEDTWRNQYACFCHGNYGTGKDGEKIPYDVLNIERKVTDIDSRAPGLKEGDERYVEVEIRRVVESLARGLNVQATHDIQQEAHSIQTTDGSLQVNLAEDTSDAESASDMNHTDVNLSDEETQDTQPGTRQEQINNNASAIHLGWDNGVAMLETASTPIDQTLASGPLTEDSGSLQSKKGTDLELRLPELVSGVNTLTRLETESNQANDPSLSGSFAAEAHNRPPGIKSDQQILHQRLSPNTDDYNRQAQTDTKPVDPPPYSADLYSNRLDAETESGGVPMQENLIEMKEGDCPTKIKYLSSEGKLPLLKIVLKPNPYTEEEMQSYYKWQCPTYAQTREALFPNFHQETAPSSESTEIPERHVKDSSVAKRTATREEIGLPAVSPFRPGSPSKSVRLGAPFLLCLLIVIMAFALSGWRTYVERTRDPVNSEHPLFL